jgi:hypothetical protein
MINEKNCNGVGYSSRRLSSLFTLRANTQEWTSSRQLQYFASVEFQLFPENTYDSRMGPEHGGASLILAPG